MPSYWVDLESANLAKQASGRATEFEVILCRQDKSLLETALRQMHELGTENQEVRNHDFLDLLKLTYRFGTSKTRHRIEGATQYVLSIVRWHDP